MRTALTLMLAALCVTQANALGGYKCRPAQFGDVGSVATWHVTSSGYCATWTCGGVTQLSVVSGEPTAAMFADWVTLRTTSSPSLFNGMRAKYAKDDPCTTLWDAWAPCRGDLTAAQLKQLCPGR